MTTILHAATNVNYKIIAELATIIWTEHYTPIIGEPQVTYMLEKYQSAIAIEDQVENGMLYYLIEHQNNPVGYFSFSKNKEFLFLSKLYVLTTARGNGIGRAALSFLEKTAKELHLKKIKLTVNRFNTNSVKAYEKMGFVIVEAVIQDIGNDYVMDDYVLEKVLK